MKKSVLFLTLWGRNAAGARLRAWNVADAWPDADCQVWPDGWPLTDPYETIILQKLYPTAQRPLPGMLEGVQQLRASGKQVFWDLCDPVWYWMGDEWFRDYAEAMTGITVSSNGLFDAMKRDHGLTATVIADRLPFMPTFRKHEPVAEPTLVWFGYGVNRIPAFMSCALTLERLLANAIPFKLKIIDDYPHLRLDGTSDLTSRTSYEPWTLGSFWSHLSKCDVALLPRYPGLWGGMKSDNKDMTASWAGLPVTDGNDYEDVKRLLTDWEYRQERGKEARTWASTYYEIHASVVEWEQLIAKTRQPVEVA